MQVIPGNGNVATGFGAQRWIAAGCAVSVNAAALGWDGIRQMLRRRVSRCGEQCAEAMRRLTIVGAPPGFLLPGRCAQPADWGLLVWRTGFI